MHDPTAPGQKGSQTLREKVFQCLLQGAGRGTSISFDEIVIHSRRHAATPFVVRIRHCAEPIRMPTTATSYHISSLTVEGFKSFGPRSSLAFKPGLNVVRVTPSPALPLKTIGAPVA